MSNSRFLEVQETANKITNSVLSIADIFFILLCLSVSNNLKVIVVFDTGYYFAGKFPAASNRGNSFDYHLIPAILIVE